MNKFVMVIDEGTTGTRALIFDKELQIVAQAYEEFTQYTPAEDKVEHDATEIYEKSIRLCKEAMETAGIGPSAIDSIGITNQRATCLVWDKETGQPLHKAIVWQDTRTADFCAELNQLDWAEEIRKTTGWAITPVYSSLMLNWLMKNDANIKARVEEGSVCFGTIDTYLIWKLTGGNVHAVSYSNASVMGSYDLEKREWYGKFLDYLGIPLSVFPEVRYDSGDFGKTAPEIFGSEIAITSSIADQHAALFAQGCLEAGTGKVTNGTGTFLDFNVGDKCVISDHGLNTVIAWDIGDGPMYALEGYAAVTGSAVQWLRDGIKLIESSKESEAVARSVEDSNGVYFVPALAGLSAPYHDPYARGMIIGITRGTTEAHIVRATLEAIAFRCRDIVDCVEKESGVKVSGISIDGGASKNNLLAQLMADFMKAEVRRPASVEATSLGAAMMAGLATGYYTREMLGNGLESEKVFEPQMPADKCDELYEGWKRAIERSSAWLK